MGASDFHSSTTVREGTQTASEAFEALHASACYDYGHAGYSGTLAEKHGFVTYPVKPDVTVYGLITALENATYWGHDLKPDADSPNDPTPMDVLQKMLVYPSEAEHIIEHYNDKWGPAVHVLINDEHHFFGYASS